MWQHWGSPLPDALAKSCVHYVSFAPAVAGRSCKGHAVIKERIFSYG